MKDECDKEMAEIVAPVYEAMKIRALEKLRSNPEEKKAFELDHVRQDGKKLTLVLYLTRYPDKIDEQFEYYQYRYCHQRSLDLI